MALLQIATLAFITCKTVFVFYALDPSVPLHIAGSFVKVKELRTPPFDSGAYFAEHILQSYLQRSDMVSISQLELSSGWNRNSACRLVDPGAEINAQSLLEVLSEQPG